MYILAAETGWIHEIGSLWKLALILALIIGMLIFKKEIRGLVSRTKNINWKSKDKELNITSDTQPEQPKENKTKAPTEGTDKEETVTDNIEGLDEEIEGNMYRAVFTGNKAEADRYYKELLENESDELAKKELKITFHGLSYKYLSSSDSLAILIKLSDDPEVKYSALSQIAYCYNRAKNSDKELETLNSMLSITPIDPKNQAYTLRRKSNLLCESNEIESAYQMIVTSLNKATDDAPKAILYKTLASIWEKKGDATMKAVMLQKVLEFSDDLTEDLFNAAYAESHTSFNRLASLNYVTLLDFKPDYAIALNNLGVEYTNQELSILGNRYYKRACNLGETLASSNLANKYIAAGFYDEADKILKEAIKAEKPHKNVSSSITNLEAAYSSEAEKRDQIIQCAKLEKSFVQNYAEAAIKPSASEKNWTGTWESDTGNIYLINFEDGILSASWEGETTGEKFTGRIVGSSAKGEYKEKKPPLFAYGTKREGTWGDKQELYAYMSDDLKLINVMIIQEDMSHFSKLKKTSE